VKDVDHFDRIVADSIENQIAAERTPTNTFMFVARYERIAARRVGKRVALFT